MAETTQRKTRRITVRRVFSVLLILALACGTAGGIGLFALIQTEKARYGGLDDVKLTSLPLTTVVLDKDGEKVSSLHSGENRVAISIAQVPQMVRNAFISAEDLRFYEHGGVDWVRVGGAALHDLRTGTLSQGASTITQQLVKLTHLTSDKTWPRKIYEAWLALEAERRYTKDQILEMYMNTVYFGAGAYGVEAAAQVYFGRHAAELSVAQAALLAAVMKSPTRYAPHIQPQNALSRRNLVLGIMRDNGFISSEECEAALDEKIVLVERTTNEKNGWYIDQVISDACAALQIDADALQTGGYVIHTELDAQLQERCEAIFAEAKYFPPDAPDGALCQGAATIVDPRTGGVRAVVGGRAYTAQRALNRATGAYRQPGSVLKPLAVYTPAFEKLGVLPSTIVYDAPSDFDGYAPQNFGGGFLGPITLRVAAAKSQNIPAVALLQQMGVQAGRDSLTRFGVTIHKDDQYLPLALGAMTVGTTTWEIASAYAVFATGGTQFKAHTISSIDGPDGASVYKQRPIGQRITSPEVAYLVTDMLRSAAMWGTAKPIGALGYPAAAKTGTNGQKPTGNRDAWTAAYTPGCSLAVWMGFDEPSAERAMPASATGGSVAAKLAAALMAAAHEDGAGDGDFTQPAALSFVDIDQYTMEHELRAVRANELTPPAYVAREPFWPGTEPTQVSSFWQRPAPPASVSVEAGESGLPRISFYAQSDNARYRVYRRQGDASPVEVVALTGPAGSLLSYVDTHATRGMTFTYYALAEHALAQDAGIDTRSLPSGMAVYTVPPVYVPEPLTPFAPSDDTVPALPMPSIDKLLPLLPQWLVP